MPCVLYGLGVREARLDVPQTVFALVALALDIARMYQFAGGRVG